MTVLEDLEKVRDDVSKQSFEERTFKKKVEDLLRKVDDEALDEINAIRDHIVVFTDHIEAMCGRLQALTWTLKDPTEKQLAIVNEIIVMGRHLFTLSKETVESLKPLWSRDVVKNEINEFGEVCSHCSEIIDDLESVFFFLPENQDFTNSIGELDKL